MSNKNNDRDNAIKTLLQLGRDDEDVRNDQDPVFSICAVAVYLQGINKQLEQQIKTLLDNNKDLNKHIVGLKKRGHEENCTIHGDFNCDCILLELLE